MNGVQSECKWMDKIANVKEIGSVTRTLPASMDDKIDIRRKLILDNIGYEQKVHHMMEEHQNNLVHWTSYMSTENRVTGKYNFLCLFRVLVLRWGMLRMRKYFT